MQAGCVHMDEDTGQELERIEVWPARVDDVLVVSVAWPELDPSGQRVKRTGARG